MCGIAGIMLSPGHSIEPALLETMTNTLRHRGPDDEGYLLVDTRSGDSDLCSGAETIPELRNNHPRMEIGSGKTRNLGMGWRRLSIIDLAPTGHQPQSSPDGSVWIVFNGEVYNYREIRQELEAKGRVFRTRSDTEVILQSYEEWDVQCLNRFNGMWAFALWDSRKRRLFCARDRFGVKPFYYCRGSDGFFFASEIKSLLSNQMIQREVNPTAISDYLLFGLSDYGEGTFFRNINQLAPGHFLTIDSEGSMSIRKYYAVDFADVLDRYDEPHCVRYAETFRDLFIDAVKLRMRTDVPLGSCLSGGLDSSSIVCVTNQLMRTEGVIDHRLIGDHQKTFTAIYKDPQFSEEAYVNSVIRKTDASPFFVYPSGEALWDELQKLVYHQDEPFNSTSIYAQWNVMRLARENNVTVLLDGQGGDELLAGYDWHHPIYHAQLLCKGRFIDYAREIFNRGRLSGQGLLKLLALSGGKSLKQYLPHHLLEKTKGWLGMFQPDVVRLGKDRSRTLDKSDTNLQRRLWQEETRYNLQQLLRYEDRNSMAFAIEARTPFIDYRLVEYVMQIPPVFKIHQGWSKYILRKGMENILPEDIRWRKDKMGFVTPEKAWFDQHKESIRQLLASSTLRSKDYIDATQMTTRFDEFMRNTPTNILWRAINLELWMRVFRV